MYIDSHLERCVLVLTAELYSPGKYVNWNFNFFNGGPMLAMENSSKSPVRSYRNCRGQVWYVHWFPSWKVCFGPNSRAVQSWEVCELEFQFFQWKSYVSYGEFFKGPCAAVQELYRSSLVCILVLILKGVFWSEHQSCTVLGSIWTGISIFSMEGLRLGTSLLCLFFHLLCYAAVLKFLTYYAQYYAHVCLKFDCSIRVCQVLYI